MALLPTFFWTIGASCQFVSTGINRYPSFSATALRHTGGPPPLCRFVLQPKLKEASEAIDEVGVTGKRVTVNVMDGSVNIIAERNWPHPHQALLVIKRVFAEQ